MCSPALPEGVAGGRQRIRAERFGLKRQGATLPEQEPRARVLTGLLQHRGTRHTTWAYPSPQPSQVRALVPRRSSREPVLA